MQMNDSYDLQRFLDAQAPVIETVQGELRRGRKRTHWMWYVFPQIAGLGYSETSRFFAMRDLDEARAYMAELVLAARLLDCSKLVLDTHARDIKTIFGEVDARKFHSCMTLFAAAAPEHPVFQENLAKYFAGCADPATLARVQPPA